MFILGVRIDNLSKKEILEKIESFLSEDKFHEIATINAEFILEAQKNKEFRNILNESSLNVADGISLKYAFVRYGKWLKCRWAGADLLHEILYLAYKHNYPIFLAINKFGLSHYDEVSAEMEKMYPMIEVNGCDIDPLNFQSLPKIAGPCILLCNFGAPLQEQFINYVKNDTIMLAMGVGGSFDFICKRVKRAPKIMRFLGLEWLYRLLFQSWRDMEFLLRRWKRVFNAVIVLPIRIIFKK
jgi:N-acetylglucosaminyldiphosphoundecaprenol N-acetyl-beta-D-mannosaminyltransferase